MVRKLSEQCCGSLSLKRIRGYGPAGADTVCHLNITLLPHAALTVDQQTVSAICSFFLAMMSFPDAQAKAQAEINRVVGSERLPSLSDRELLPYVKALTWEVLRWQPIAPLGGRSHYYSE